MPAIAAIPTALASVGGALIGSNAASNAAKLQSKAAADALTFQQQQAQIAEQNFQQTQKANYGQWAADTQNQYGVANSGETNDYNRYAARDQRIGSIGELLGMGPRTTPANVAIPQPIIPSYQGTADGSTPIVPSGGSKFDISGNVAAALKASNSADDPAYWNRVIAADKNMQGPDAQKVWSTFWAPYIARGEGVGRGYQSTAGALTGAH